MGCMGYGLNMGYPILGYPMFSPCIGNGECMHALPMRTGVRMSNACMNNMTMAHDGPWSY